MSKSNNRLPNNSPADNWPERVKESTMNALIRLLDGEVITTTKKQDILKSGQPTGYQKRTVTRTQTLPDARTVIFMMEHLFPERFTKRQAFEISGKPGFALFSPCFKSGSDYCESRLILVPDRPKWEVYISPRGQAAKDQNFNRLKSL